METLKRCEFFSDLSGQEVRTIGKSGRVEEFEAGQTIYEQGDVGIKLYIPSKGQVSLDIELTMGQEK